jgi:hypothetical protein
LLAVLGDLAEFERELTCGRSRLPRSEVAHHAFHHWIRGYYSAAQKYLEAGREMEPSQWEFVKLLFDVTNEVEQEKVRKTATSDSLLDSAEIADFLDEEIDSRPHTTTPSHCSR